VAAHNTNDGTELELSDIFISLFIRYELSETSCAVVFVYTIHWVWDM